MATTLTPSTLNLSLCLRLSVAQTVIPVLHASHRRR